MEREQNMSAEGARDLLHGFLVGQVTRLEVAHRADLWMSTVRLEDEDWPEGLLDALTELFPLGGQRAARSARRARRAGRARPRARARGGRARHLHPPGAAGGAARDAPRSRRRPTRSCAPASGCCSAPPAAARPCSALLDGRVDVLTAWLERTVLDPEAFLGTTWDVPLLDVGGLAGLVRRLVADTELLPPGAARAMVADEWVAELATDSLPDDSSFGEVVRAIGEPLLESDAPVLLWHAVQELAIVTEDDPELAERVLERCLPMSDAEQGRCPAAAAAPLLGNFAVDDAADLLDRVSPRLDADAWDAIAREYLGRELAAHWLDWRPHVQRWATAPDRTRADAVRRAVELAGTPEREALAWFADRG